MFRLSETSIEQVERCERPHPGYLRRLQQPGPHDIMPRRDGDTGTGTGTGTGIGPGVLVETESGVRCAKDIAPGDRVMTREHGFLEVLWAGREHCRYGGSHRMRPVRLARKAAGGPGCGGAMIFAPAQRLMLQDQRNELYFGARDVLCQLGDLLHLDAVSPVSRRYAVDWVHLLFEATVLMRAGGLWLESLAPDMRLLRWAEAGLAAEIEQAVPALRYDHGQAAYVPPLPVLDTREARLLGAGVTLW